MLHLTVKVKHNKTNGLMLHLTIKVKHSKTNGHKETFGGDGYVYYFDRGDSITVVGMCQTYQTVCIKNVPFFCTATITQ